VQVLSIGKKKRVYAIAFSPSGEELATVSGDYLLRIWDLATGTERHSAPVGASPSGYDLAYLDAGRIVVAAQSLQVWDVAANAWQLIAPDPVWGRRVAVSPDGRFTVDAGQTRSTLAVDELLVLRSTADWARTTVPDGESATGGLAFSRDGRFLATGHMAEAGQRTRTRTVGMLSGFQYQTPEYDYLVRVREMPSGRVVQMLDGWQQAITHLAFSPDGNVIAGTAGPRLRVWDRQSDRELALHKRGPKHFQGISFAHDGSALATVSNDATVRIWETQTWQEHTTFTWDVGALLNIRFAPDGLRAAAGSDRGQIVIWDVQ